LAILPAGLLGLPNPETHMDEIPFEVVVSWEPDDYEMEPDEGREKLLLDRLIAKKDWDNLRVLVENPYLCPSRRGSGNFIRATPITGRHPFMAIIPKNPSSLTASPDRCGRFRRKTWWAGSRKKT
jgi:hypothetical protein